MPEAGTKSGAVRVVLNGAERSLEGVATVADLVERLGFPVERVAVELDGAIVRKAAYASTPVKEGAHLEIVSFVGGG
ncbi:MAG TPA: sulfur carrier protein ThiS [Thermoanaerobaculia bacterium]|nr:sulfur carrier protein ThiS [Thermoanaerobaculia bacterium]